MKLKNMARRSSTNWISPSFDQWKEVKDNGNSFSSSESGKSSVSNNGSKKVKRNYNYLKNRKVKHDVDTSWTVKCAPETKDELAVHKKKVQEVEDWLKKNLNLCDSYQHPGLLLLTGPAGSGKTATIKALANELKFEIQEWMSTPCESMSYSSYVDGVRQWNDAHDIMCQSQNAIFGNFLLRVNKYPSLFTSFSNRVILIEEFPNLYLKDPASFHNLLRKFCRTSKCPAVFIVSDSTSNESLENRLFPKNIQVGLNITNISFNPIAPTLMVKALNRICSVIRDSGIIESMPDKSVIEDITSGSMGDIRSAVNALQFFNIQKKSSSSQSTSGLKRKKSDSHQKDIKTGQGSRNQRDSTLFLFHALGKILYCKRDTSAKLDNEKLPYHLSHLGRYPLISNPEEVFEKTSISAENFALFLHENYLAFINNVDIATECSSYLSDADIISVEWTGRDVLNNYISSVAARGLMFNLDSSNTGHRWKAIHKPQYFASIKENRNLSSSLRNMFKGTRLSLKELKIEFLPYLSKIGISSLNAEEVKMVHHIGQMTVNKFIRCQGESLSEKDFIKEETQSQLGVLLPSILEGSEIDGPDSESEEDNVVIEEYDF